MKKLYVRGFFNEQGLINLKDYGMNINRLQEDHCRMVFYNVDDKKFSIMSSNEFESSYFVDFNRFTISEMLDFTQSVRDLYNQYDEAFRTFVEFKEKRGGCQNREYSQREIDEINSCSLVDLYRTGKCSVPVISVLAKGLCGIDDFDFRKHSLKEIDAMVCSYRGEGRISMKSEKRICNGRGL